MTTSVIYPADEFGYAQAGPATQALAYTRSLATAATVVEQLFSSGAGTTMTTGTLTATPTSGDVLIACIYRQSDNQSVTSAPSGWALLTANGASGSRRLEIWWYRSTGVVGDKGSHTFSTASGAGGWAIDFYDFGGNAACGNPVVASSATNNASASSLTLTGDVSTTVAAFSQPGMYLTAFVGGGGTLGSTPAGSVSGTGTAESHTVYADGTWQRGGSSVIDLYNNATYSTETFGTAWTWTTARVTTSAVILLKGGGTYSTVAGSYQPAGAGIKGTGSVGSPTYPGGNGQHLTEFDTSSIPDTNTISSATLTVRAGDKIGSGLSALSTDDPANADLQARYYGTSMPSNTRGNNNNHWWLTSAAFAAKTLVASYAAAGAWTNNTDYALTSNGSNLASNVNKTGSTVIAWGTSDQADQTSRTTAEMYGINDPGTYTTLTVIHTFVGSATVSATAGLTPTLSRVASFPRTIAATLDGVPVLSRVPEFARTIAASLDAVPVLSRVPEFARTIAATVTATPGIVASYLPVVTGIPHVVSLKVRNTVSLAQQSKISLKVRNLLRLPEN